MAIENVQQLLTEQLGKNPGTEILTGTDAGTSKDFYCVYFPVETVVSVLKVAGVAEAGLQTTFSAGVSLFLNVTDITLTSGTAICYNEGPTT